MEMFCQFIYSDRLSKERGFAYWQALAALDIPIRPWSADEYQLGSDHLRESCKRGERHVAVIGEEEWIVSADWDIGTLNLTGDLDLASAGTRGEHVPALIRTLDCLFLSLQPRFGWADGDGVYPKGLTAAVLETRLRWLFWINYFGASYLAKYGMEMFLNAPFQSAEALEGGVKCVAAATPERGEHEACLRDLCDYFSTAGMNVRPYAL